MRHYWQDGHHDAWTWIVPGIVTLLLGLVLVAVLALLWRSLSHRAPGPPAPAPHWQGDAARSAVPTPQQVLAARLASGEIDVDEYRLRLAVLHEAPSPARRPGDAAPPPPG